jgi:hypothetical protein
MQTGSILMTRHLSRFGALVLAGTVAVSLGLPGAASAQRTRSAGGDSGDRSGGGDSGGGARAIPRTESAPRGGGDSGGRATPAPSPSPSAPSRARTSSESSSSGGSEQRAVSRPREDRPPVGQAVPRSTAPPPNIIIGGGGGYYYPGYYPYYPWGYGGIGFGAYYGWGPWYYGSWYGPPYYGGGYYYGGYDGGIRLKVKPSQAEVFVDGYYVGIVDEFDNPFQQLQLESGPHRIEVRQSGYESVTFEVRVVPGKTITYRAEMKKQP